MDKIQHVVYDYIIASGFTETSAKYLNMLALLLALFIGVYILDFLIRKLLVNAFNAFALRSKTDFDNILVKNKAPRNIAHIIPLLLAIEVVPMVFYDFPFLEVVVEKTLKVLGIMLTLWIARSLLHTIKDYLKTKERFNDKPIDSYIQVFMIFAWVVGIFSAFAIISGISFWKFAGTLGAASAIIILVFRDTILGFVASIQVSINDMVRIGDWITFEKYGADGDVIEINLATVKVQNFDKTITTIPTYALISDSFKNWRGMDESGGRRIKRALLLKTSSIHYLTPESIEKLKEIQLINAYLVSQQKTIDTFNQNASVDKSVLINGRNLTNIGVFRKYLQTYIENHSAINKDMTIMVRQMAPTSQGIPLEIYAFSGDKRWLNYEYIVSDLFDHAIAAVPYFELEIFEFSSGNLLDN